MTNKVLLVTTKDKLETVCKWVDKKLPGIYAQNISDKIDVATLSQMTPKRLDKPLMTAASKVYADLLCKCPSYATVTTTGKNKFN